MQGRMPNPKEGTDGWRDVLCSQYRKCINKVVEEKWKNWHCSLCYFNKPIEQEVIPENKRRGYAWRGNNSVNKRKPIIKTETFRSISDSPNFKEIEKKQNNIPTKEEIHKAVEQKLKSRIILNFANKKKLFESLAEIAEAEHRTIEEQIFYFIDFGVHRYIKQERV